MQFLRLKIMSLIRFARYLLTGNWKLVRQIINFYIYKACVFFARMTPIFVKKNVLKIFAKINALTSSVESASNKYAIDEIVSQRISFSKYSFEARNGVSNPQQKNIPPIDISIVTFNSSKWLARFFDSIRKVDFHSDLVFLYVVDNGSTDDTILILNAEKKKFEAIGISFTLTISKNVGFGAGHNKNFLLCKSPFVLVTNVDLFFEDHALSSIIQYAAQDNESVAAWEFRQKPYEHPKYYDPVTGLTNWNSHACVLLRRDAVQKINGYDESIFMYGEDVEISYHLRSIGYSLKYYPIAVVWHDAYETAGQIKPLQFSGSIYANFYLRLKYGNAKDVLAIYTLYKKLIFENESFPEFKKIIKNIIWQLPPQTLLLNYKRKKFLAYFSFRGLDYELTRFGAFYKQQKLSDRRPLVTIITRTHNRREAYLRDAIISVSRQTYPNIEHIIVEDGGDSQLELCAHATNYINKNLHYLSLDKVGRCVAGNKGLEYAKGNYCLFLDDDDILFADHVEVLLTALLNSVDYVAAYSPAMEIHTDIIDEQTGAYRETDHSFPSGLFKEYSFEDLFKHNYIAIQSILFNRSLYLERGGFDEKLQYLEDWNLWVRYGYRNKFLYVPKLTSMYRVPASTTYSERRFQLLNDSTNMALNANIKAIDGLL